MPTTLNDQSITGNWANNLFTDTFGFSPDFTPDNWDKTGTPIAIGEQMARDFGTYFESKLPSAQYREGLYERARNLPGDAERAIARMNNPSSAEAAAIRNSAKVGAEGLRAMADRVGAISGTGATTASNLSNAAGFLAGAAMFAGAALAVGQMGLKTYDAATGAATTHDVMATAAGIISGGLATSLAYGFLVAGSIALGPALIAAAGAVAFGFVIGKIGQSAYDAWGHSVTNGLGDVGRWLAGAAYDHVTDFVNSLFLAAKSWTAPRDPLVLDLDGDGIETAGIDPNAPVLFDMDGDGVKTATGWIRPDDGIVVLDRNGNGLIDSGRELFGDATVLARGARAGQLAANGFEALADLDLNADGRLDSLDASWGQLRIWRDLNQDGVSQAGELTTLAAQGIARLGAQGTQSNVNLGGGNTQVMSGSFTRTNGMLGTSGVAEVAGSLLLASNNFYRDFTDEVALTPAAQSLPQMQGSGLVRDLREAMSLGTAQAGALRADANNASNHIAPESIAAFPCKSCARGRFDAKKKVCRRHRLIWVISEKEQRISAAANAFIED